MNNPAATPLSYQYVRFSAFDLSGSSAYALFSRLSEFVEQLCWRLLFGASAGYLPN